MSVRVVSAPDGTQIVHAEGDIDLYSSPELRKCLLNALQKSTGAVYVDLHAVNYMDSSGVATLIEGLKTAGQKKTEYALIAPSASVLRVLQLAKLDTVFTIRDAQ